MTPTRLNQVAEVLAAIKAAPEADRMDVLATAVRAALDSKIVHEYRNCSCGHPWLRHDVEEYRGDGSETCCVEGCPQIGCPGRDGTP